MGKHELDRIRNARDCHRGNPRGGLSRDRVRMDGGILEVVGPKRGVGSITVVGP